MVSIFSVSPMLPRLDQRCRQNHVGLAISSARKWTASRFLYHSPCQSLPYIIRQSGFVSPRPFGTAVCLSQLSSPDYRRFSSWIFLQLHQIKLLWAASLAIKPRSITAIHWNAEFVRFMYICICSLIIVSSGERYSHYYQRDALLWSGEITTEIHKLSIHISNVIIIDIIIIIPRLQVATLSFLLS